MKLKNCGFLLLFLLMSLTAFSQDQAAEINQDFDNLIKKSNDYQSYKVVKKRKLQNLKQKVSDKITGLQDELQEKDAKVKEQKRGIEKVETELKGTKKDLKEIKTSRDQISFIGIQLSKSSYQAIMWGAIGVLGLFILILIVTKKKNSADTREAKMRLKQEQRDFEDFRKKSLEKQQKLGRKLQDEINRNKKSTNPEM